MTGHMLSVEDELVSSTDGGPLSEDELVSSTDGGPLSCIMSCIMWQTEGAVGVFECLWGAAELFPGIPWVSFVEKKEASTDRPTLLNVQ